MLKFSTDPHAAHLLALSDNIPQRCLPTKKQLSLCIVNVQIIAGLIIEKRFEIRYFHT